MLFAFCVSTHAQQTGTIPRIGYLNAVSPSSDSDRIDSLRQGLRELGYLEGKNIFIESRYAEGRLDRLAVLAAELVRLKVAVIVTSGPQPTRVTKEATSTIPIVMAQDGDPVGNGFVASLARPGGNITGLSRLAPELKGKQLELLKETLPRLSRVAAFGTSTQPGNAQALREAEFAAAALAVKLQYLDILVPKEIENAFRIAGKARADAIVWMVPSRIDSSHRKEVVELAVKNRLPVIYPGPDIVKDGGLMAYGVSIDDLNRRAASFVDKILKGRKPADLPVEQPTKFEFIVNLKAARQIGVPIPPNILARADRVIR